MKHFTFFFCFFFLITNLHAAEGDITEIIAHDKVDMTWYGAYDQVVEFPEDDKTYSKILMHYTLGCSSNGCSDWDYDAYIRIMEDTGILDSSVASLDTISTDPMMVDTTWNYFTIVNQHEMARLVTPYGTYMASGSNGYNNSWEHKFVYDVTDFAPYLKGEQTLRAFYSGWSDGFSVSVRFEFVEGTPKRDVLKIENLYGGFSYNTPAEVEAGPLSPKNITIDENATNTKIRVTITGHGFDNNTSCAEFCPRDYYIKIDGAQYFQKTIWRDDCGSVDVFPQGGTWIYNRAGWCPGDKVIVDEFDISHIVKPGQSHEIDMDLQDIIWAGTQAPSYSLSFQVVSYSNNYRVHDVAILDVIKPSKKDEHMRQNPVCSDPTIVIRNTGTEELTSTLITYGVEGVGGFSLESCMLWEGNLKAGEIETVTLPPFNWQNFDPENPIFYATLSHPNGYLDTYQTDNTYRSPFDIPVIYEEGIKVEMRMNNKPFENAYTLKNAMGEVIYSGNLDGNEWSAGQVITVPFTGLNNGECYSFHFTDYGDDWEGGDGLSWWVNTQNGIESGIGYVRLLDKDDNIIMNFNSDFGNEIIHNFTYKSALGSAAANTSLICNIDLGEPMELEEPLGIENTNLAIDIYPNPTNDGLIYVDLEKVTEVKNIAVYDIFGRKVSETGQLFIKNHQVQLPDVAGMYFVHITTDEGDIMEDVLVH